MQNYIIRFFQERGCFKPQKGLYIIHFFVEALKRPLVTSLTRGYSDKDQGRITVSAYT